jgi:Zn-dependent protease
MVAGSQRVKTLLLLLNAAKLGKILTTGGTMLLSVFAYSFVFGWRYAAGFVLLMLVHELGHYFAARQEGLAVGAPTFIPFLGAWIELKDQPLDARQEAYIGLAGPLVGSAGALACFFFARNYDSPLLLAISYAGFFLNLVNLVPLLPFDGGRITGAISPKVWFIGVPVLVAMTFYNPSPIFIIIALLALPSMWKVWREGTDANARYYDVPLEVRSQYALVYLALLAFLGLMTYELHQELPRGRFD